MSLDRYQQLMRRSLQNIQRPVPSGEEEDEDFLEGFRSYRSSGQRTAVEKPGSFYNIKVCCLNGPLQSVKPATVRRLKSKDLGSKKIMIKRKGTLSDLKNLIMVHFPVLTGQTYQLKKSRKTNAFVLADIEANTLQGVKTELGRGALYVVPELELAADEEEILPPIRRERRPTSTATLEHSSQLARTTDEEGIFPPIHGERRPTSTATLETSSIMSPIRGQRRPTSTATSEDSLILPPIRRQSRPTSTATSENSLILPPIRGQSRPTSTAISENSSVTPPRPEMITVDDQPPVDNMGMSVTELRAQQDAEYAASLQTDCETDVPLIRRPRAQRMSRTQRPAATAARSQIRRWCNRVTPPRPEMITVDDQPPVDNMGMSVTELRAQQDAEYAASLQTDCETVLQQQIADQRERRAREQTQQSEINASEIQQGRRENLPPEPAEGFVLKLRHGPQRIFREFDSVDVLINFVGSQPNATTDFYILINGMEKLASWMTGRNLCEVGLTQSSIMEVEWGATRPSSENMEMSYDELIATLEGGDEVIDEEDPQTVDVLPEDPHSPTDIREILVMWRSTVMDMNSYQNLRISRSSTNLVEQVCMCFERGSFDLKKQLKVEFRNEPGLDEGGLRREFFEIIIRKIINSKYMEETDKGFIVSNNVLALVENRFRTLGMVIGSMVLQGGPVQPVFSHSMLAYASRGLQAATVDTVRSSETRMLIEKIRNGDISGDDDKALDAMSAAGIGVVLNDRTRSSVAKALTSLHSELTQRQPMLEQFWAGAEAIGFRSLLSSHPEIESLLCRECGHCGPITADEFIRLLDFDTHGEHGSNARVASEDVSQNFETFVYECEDGKCDGIGVPRLLRFLTGASCLPPGGLDTKINIHFVDAERYPVVGTCTLDLTLSLTLTSYANFKKVMINAIVCGQGFGNV